MTVIASGRAKDEHNARQSVADKLVGHPNARLVWLVEPKYLQAPPGLPSTTTMGQFQWIED